MPLKDDWVSGNSFTANDQNDVADAVNSIQVSVKDYGAVGDGTADDTVAIQDAWTAVGQSGVLHFPAGRYKVTDSDLIVMNYPGQSLEGVPGATFIEPTSAVTGDVIRWQMDPFTNEQAGHISGLTIAGAAAGSGACGIHVGDVVHHRITDVVVKQFDDSGVGIHVDNVTHWTESFTWANVYADRNTVNVLFDVNGGTDSWGYNRMGLQVNCAAGQTGVRFQGGGHLYNAEFAVVGNVSDTGAVGVDLKDTTTISGDIRIMLECNTAGAKGLQMASGTYITGQGFIECADVGSAAFTNSNAGTGNIVFSGWFDVPGAGGWANAPLLASSSVNFPLLFNAPSGSPVEFNAVGADSNISILFAPKGTGGFSQYVNSQTTAQFTASGSQTNINIDMWPKGTGRLKANGNVVPEIVAAPASAGATGVAGQVAYDSSFFYVCTAANTWKRVAIATW